MIVVVINGKHLHFSNGLLNFIISNYLYILQEDETSLFVSSFGKYDFNESPPNIGNGAINMRKN